MESSESIISSSGVLRHRDKRESVAGTHSEARLAAPECTNQGPTGLVAIVVFDFARSPSSRSRESPLLTSYVCRSPDGGPEFAWENDMGTQPNAARKQVIRDVEPAALRDLLQDPPRATLAFVDGEEVEVVPVRYRLYGDAHLIGVRGEGAAALADREVVLVIDDGAFWFELRGISVRGVAKRVDRAGAEWAGCAWYAIAPQRVLAWDYGTIREA